MKLVRPCISTALLLAGVAHAYDIRAYCKTVSEAAGGSYVIEEECRKQEALARANLARNPPAARIEKYCEEVGSVIGGSYAIKEECVKQETHSRGRLQ